MTEKVTPLPRRPERLNSKKLGSQYDRVARDNSELLSPITEELKNFCDSNLIEDLNESDPEAEYIWGVAAVKPFENVHGIRHVELQNLIPRFNALLLYRILKLTYGEPDVTGAITSKARGEVILVTDWGYTLKINKTLFVEVRSVQKNRWLVLQFWSTLSQNKISDKGKMKTSIIKFLEDLKEDYDKNSYLFKEEKSISSQTPRAIVNVFSEKYTAAKRLSDLALYDISEDSAEDILVDDETPAATLRYIYLSAATLFIVSLEGLVNSLYHFLLRDELRQRDQQDNIRKRSIESKLAEIHLLCRGFERCAVPLGSELWKNFSEIRTLRNEILHGNITDEHKIFSIIEDHLIFSYYPATEFRGSAKEGRRRLSPSMPNFSSRHVDQIKKIVDDVKDALLQAMDEQTRDWANRWLHDSVIVDPAMQETPGDDVGRSDDR